MSATDGVGNKPYSLSSVGRIDTARRYNNGRDLIPKIFQLSTHLVEDQASVPISEAANVFAHDETRGNLAYCSKHLWP